MEATKYLVNLMRSFIAGDTDAVDFASNFENHFLDHEEEIEAADQATYDLLDGLRWKSIEYFQPDEKIRMEADYLLDEDQLKTAVRKQLEMIEL